MCVKGKEETQHRMKGPQSKQAEACIRNCIPTCTRGGEGTLVNRYVDFPLSSRRGVCGYNKQCCTHCNNYRYPCRSTWPGSAEHPQGHHAIQGGLQEPVVLPPGMRLCLQSQRA